MADYVDPTIGGIGFLLEPTRPTAHLPNSMVRVYPIRKDQADDRISGFPLTIISHRLGELFCVMPVPRQTEAGGPVHDPAEAYDQEVTHPYYYSTRFDDSLIRTEFAPAERAGIFRFTSPSEIPTLRFSHRQPGDYALVGNQGISGTERFHGMQAYFYGEFNQTVKLFSSDSAQITVAAADDSPERQLIFRYGISFISTDQARSNLAEEIPSWDIETVRNRAKDRWNRTLGQIQVEGGSEAQRRLFYTSLYRCCERMVNISEGGRYYSAFDHKVHDDPRPFYVDNWIWDMFRSLQPLQAILHPQMQADEIASYVRMCEQGGWMPSFAVLWGDYPCMTGNHAAAWIADAWFKDIRNYDLKAAYEGLKKNSLEATLLPWRNGPATPLDRFYSEHGFFPALRPGETETEPALHPWEKRQAISVTLENSYDDWCIAQLARELNHPEDEALFLRRAAFYKNVFREDKHSVWPKDSDGHWIEPFDPKFSGGQGGRDYTTENNAYTYDWYVPHDLQGLFNLMGGRAAAEAQLDQLFREGLDRSKYEFWAKFPDSTGMVGQFSMGNEPSFHIPYLYNHLGAPWKTQKRIRMLLATCFSDTLQGIPGDEDGGAISAFVVFSMMGLYPTVAGIPVYDIGSPLFRRVVIHLENGKDIEIRAPASSQERKYIQSVRLDGKPLPRLWIRHSEIENGATLDLEMTDTPNRNLGASAEDLPPSEIDLDPRRFAGASSLK